MSDMSSGARAPDYPVAETYPATYPVTETYPATETYDDGGGYAPPLSIRRLRLGVQEAGHEQYR